MKAAFGTGLLIPQTNFSLRNLAGTKRKNISININVNKLLESLHLLADPCIFMHRLHPCNLNQKSRHFHNKQVREVEMWRGATEPHFA